VCRSNCFFFAAIAWWRWRRKGAYWWMRESRHIAGWHWGVYYRGRFIHYDVLEPRSPWWRAAIHKLWYEGRIRRNDGTEP
jgi:hypothetical protein